MISIKSIQNKLIIAYLRDRLKLVVGKPMSNLEINNYFNKSLVVWNAYRRSMQSGVLPKAYMFGTPVIIVK